VKIFDFPLAKNHSRPYSLHMSNTTTASAKSITINFEVTMGIYTPNGPSYKTEIGEFYGFATRSAAKRHLTNHLKKIGHDGIMAQRITFFRE
jgi:hypothetical protein